MVKFGDVPVYKVFAITAESVTLVNDSKLEVKLPIDLFSEITLTDSSKFWITTKGLVLEVYPDLNLIRIQGNTIMPTAIYISDNKVSHIIYRDYQYAHSYCASLDSVNQLDPIMHHSKYYDDWYYSGSIVYNFQGCKCNGFISSINTGFVEYIEHTKEYILFKSGANQIKISVTSNGLISRIINLEQEKKQIEEKATKLDLANKTKKTVKFHDTMIHSIEKFHKGKLVDGSGYTYEPKEFDFPVDFNTKFVKTASGNMEISDGKLMIDGIDYTTKNIIMVSVFDGAIHHMLYRDTIKNKTFSVCLKTKMKINIFDDGDGIVYDLPWFITRDGTVDHIDMCELCDSSTCISTAGTMETTKILSHTDYTIELEHTSGSETYKSSITGIYDGEKYVFTFEKTLPKLPIDSYVPNSSNTPEVSEMQIVAAPSFQLAKPVEPDVQKHKNSKKGELIILLTDHLDEITQDSITKDAAFKLLETLL
jgi:hypothetical protein